MYTIIQNGYRQLSTICSFSTSARLLASSFKEHKEALATVERKVFVWGAGRDFQLATEQPKDGVSSPLEVEALRGKDVVSVCAGWVTSFAVTAQGQAYAWGSNQNGALTPLEDENNKHSNNNNNNNNNNENDVQKITHFTTPTLLRLLHPETNTPLRVKKIQAARAHTLVLDLQGRLFSFGSADLGQLGNGLHGDALQSSRLVAVSPPEGLQRFPAVRDVACGLDHTVALTEDGRVFAWGLANDGQLGVGELPEAHPDFLAVPRMLELDAFGAPLPRIARVAAGSDSTALLSAEGALLVCGSNASKQLGLGEDVECAWFPEALDFSGRRVVDFAMGGTFGLALTEDLAVWVWGWNGEDGRLGMEGRGKAGEAEAVPVENRALSALRPRMMRAGGGHSVVVDEKGQFHAFGFGAGGRLGLGAENPERSVRKPTPVKLLNSPRSFQRVVDLSTGYDHNILVVE